MYRGKWVKWMRTGYFRVRMKHLQVVTFGIKLKNAAKRGSERSNSFHCSSIHFLCYKFFRSFLCSIFMLLHPFYYFPCFFIRNNFHGNFLSRRFKYPMVKYCQKISLKTIEAVDFSFWVRKKIHGYNFVAALNFYWDFNFYKKKFVVFTSFVKWKIKFYAPWIYWFFWG